MGWGVCYSPVRDVAVLGCVVFRNVSQWAGKRPQPPRATYGFGATLCLHQSSVFGPPPCKK